MGVSLALASVLLSATMPPPPVTFGFSAVQCVQIRPVVCVIDPRFEWKDCLHNVRTAINIINEAIGRDVFEPAGIITMQGAENAFKQGVLIVGIDNLPDIDGNKLLGLTSTRIEISKKNVCITNAATALSPDILKRFNSVRIATLVHEFIHALGGQHADESGFFLSRMVPRYVKATWWLTPADERTLRAVYGDINYVRFQDRPYVSEFGR